MKNIRIKSLDIIDPNGIFVMGNDMKFSTEAKTGSALSPGKTAQTFEEQGREQPHSTIIINNDYSQCFANDRIKSSAAKPCYMILLDTAAVLEYLAIDVSIHSFLLLRS